LLPKLRDSDFARDLFSTLLHISFNYFLTNEARKVILIKKINYICSRNKNKRIHMNLSAIKNSNRLAEDFPAKDSGRNMYFME
jgi:hypothetical protein